MTLVVCKAKTKLSSCPPILMHCESGTNRRTALHCTALHCTALHCTALHKAVGQPRSRLGSRPVMTGDRVLLTSHFHGWGSFLLDNRARCARLPGANYRVTAGDRWAPPGVTASPRDTRPGGPKALNRTLVIGLLTFWLRRNIRSQESTARDSCLGEAKASHDAASVTTAFRLQRTKPRHSP
jgi:hypothetical protein